MQRTCNQPDCWANRFRAALLVLLVVPGLLIAQGHGPRVTVILPGYRSPVNMDTIGVSFEAAAEPSQVFAAAAGALRDAGIEPELRDSSGTTIGNLQLKVLRRLGNVPLVRYVDCGMTQAGRKADFYRVHLAVLVRLEPAGEHRTKVTTAVASGAQNMGGPLADPIACASSGALEDQIRALVEKRLTEMQGKH